MEFLEIIKAIILGIVEGITEWLPISSTGHMILVDEVLKLNMSFSCNSVRCYFGSYPIILEKNMAF